MRHATCDLGLVGLGVMGRNLALNFTDHGFKVAIYNRTPDKTRNFVAGAGAGRSFYPTYSPAELLELLRPPRAVLVMVSAGTPVDAARIQPKRLA